MKYTKYKWNKEWKKSHKYAGHESTFIAFLGFWSRCRNLLKFSTVTLQCDCDQCPDRVASIIIRAVNVVSFFCFAFLFIHNFLTRWCNTYIKINEEKGWIEQRNNIYFLFSICVCLTEGAGLQLPVLWWGVRCVPWSCCTIHTADALWASPTVARAKENGLTKEW